MFAMTVRLTNDEDDGSDDDILMISSLLMMQQNPAIVGDNDIGDIDDDDNDDENNDCDNDQQCGNTCHKMGEEKVAGDDCNEREVHDE